jgi:hypothetical protein
MKAQFKYAFKTGLTVRWAAFAVIFVMDAVFIALGSLGLLPFAAQVTAVSLGGVAISVMLVFDIIGHIADKRRMFSVPEAYLYALTPVPRWKTLLASVIVTAVLDIVTMAVVITAEVWLSLILAGTEEIWRNVLDFINTHGSEFMYGFGYAALLVAGYLLLMMVIIFCITVKMSILYKTPASGLLTFLLACACFYVVSLLQLVLIPFGIVDHYGLLIILQLGNNVLPFYALLTLLEAAALFVITSKLMERRINL